MTCALHTRTSADSFSFAASCRMLSMSVVWRESTSSNVAFQVSHWTTVADSLQEDHCQECGHADA